MIDDDAQRIVLKSCKDILSHCGNCRECYMLMSATIVSVIRHHEEWDRRKTFGDKS